MDISIHLVTNIECLPIEVMKTDDGTEFYVRYIIITHDNGARVVIHTFSDDGYALLANDKEQEKLLQAA